MKRAIALALVLFSLCGLAACGDGAGGAGDTYFVNDNRDGDYSRDKSE